MNKPIYSFPYHVALKFVKPTFIQYYIALVQVYRNVVKSHTLEQCSDILSLILYHPATM